MDGRARERGDGLTDRDDGFRDENDGSRSGDDRLLHRDDGGLREGTDGLCHRKLRKPDGDRRTERESCIAQHAFLHES